MINDSSNLSNKPFIWELLYKLQDSVRCNECKEWTHFRFSKLEKTNLKNFQTFYVLLV